MLEIWKDIRIINGIDYKGHYQISNLQRVRSVDRYIIYKNGTGRLHIGIILSQHHDADGYRIVNLSYKSIGKTMKTHRLIGIYFILNPLNLPEINHINGIRDDNRIKNLEWCTKKENQKHKYILGYRNPSGVNNCRSIEINQLTLGGEFIKTWHGIKEVGRILNISQGAISNVCTGRQKTAGGFIWKYK